MPLILNGTTGVSGVDGSAGTPSYQGTDTNTGIFYPAADTIAFAEGGAEVMRIDSSGNVGIGTSSPVFASGGGLSIYNAAAARIKLGDSTSGIGSLDGVELVYDDDAYLWNRENTALIFGTNSTERMRIDSSGNVKLSTAGTKILNSSGNPILQQTGSVLQVVNSTVGYVTTTSAVYVDTGLTATITPTSSTSKVLVLVNLNMISTTANNQVVLFRLANGSGTPLQVMIDYTYSTSQAGILVSSLSYLHSPATTSAYTYKIQYATNNSNTLRLNDYFNAPALSTITLLEIAA